MSSAPAELQLKYTVINSCESKRVNRTRSWLTPATSADEQRASKPPLKFTCDQQLWLRDLQIIVTVSEHRVRSIRRLLTQLIRFGGW
jgi:hypothetical protein